MHYSTVQYSTPSQPIAHLRLHNQRFDANVPIRILLAADKGRARKPVLRWLKKRSSSSSSTSCRRAKLGAGDDEAPP